MSDPQTTADPCQALVNAVSAAQAVVDAASIALLAAQAALAICRTINPTPVPVPPEA